MTTQTETRRFEDVIGQVERAPRNQRVDKLISGIAQQMQQSNNQNLTPAQLGQDLNQIRSRLVEACQQGD